MYHNPNRNNPNRFEAYLSVTYRITFTKEGIKCETNKYFIDRGVIDIKAFTYSYNTGLGYQILQDIHSEFDAIKSAHDNQIDASAEADSLTRHIASRHILPGDVLFYSFTYFGS